MKFLRIPALFAMCVLLGWLSIGCSQAQVAPTGFKVNLSWTAPAGCTTASPCTFVASRITLAAGVTSCPAVNTATPNYAPLNAASPSTGTTFADTTAPGLNVCYIAQTEQGGQVSAPSNVVGPFAVPASPLAPSLTGNQAVAEMNCSVCRFEPPLNTDVIVAEAIDAPAITGTLTRGR
jgi:hypothetical protein